MQGQQEIVEEDKELNTEPAQDSSQSNDTVDSGHTEQDAETENNTLETEGATESVFEEESDTEAIAEVLSNPNYSKGEKKRIAKLLSEKHELLQKLAEERAFNNELKGNTRAPVQNQFQQPDPALDERLDPSSPKFDYKYHLRHELKQMMEEEKKQESLKIHQDAALNDLNKVAQVLQRAQISDPSFAHLWKQYGHLMTPDMLYGLVELEKPHLFLKHVFKNEKDVLALQNLRNKHPSEQSRRMTALGLSFEHNAVNKGGVSSTPRKIPPIPTLGNKRGSTSSYKNGYNPETNSYDPQFINKFIS